MSEVCKKCFNMIDVFTQMCPLGGLCVAPPPKTPESPQEIPERCQWSMLGVGQCRLSDEHGDDHDYGPDPVEPKPAPQEMMCFQYGCSNTVTPGWHLCDEHKPAPQVSRSRPYIVTAEQWKESAIALEAEVTRLEAAQAPLLQKIAELEAEVKVLRGALIYIGRKVGCLLSDEISTGFIATGVPDEVTAKIAELEEMEKALAQVNKLAFDLAKELEGQLDAEQKSHKITLEREAATTARYDAKLEEMENKVLYMGEVQGDLKTANHFLGIAEARVKELESQIEAAKVEGFKWVDVNQEMPAPDLDTFVIAKFTKKFLSTPGVYNRRPCEIVSTSYLSTFTRNYTHWAALPDAPTVADSKRGEE